MFIILSEIPHFLRGSYTIFLISIFNFISNDYYDYNSYDKEYSVKSIYHVCTSALVLDSS